jgi:CBS domain-containing protein
MAICAPVADTAIGLPRVSHIFLAGTRFDNECRSGINVKGEPMLVSEAMTRDVHVCNPVHSIRDCAGTMAEIDAGVLPVAENGLLVGMITDRDIAIRAVAAGKGPDTPVSEVLSKEVLYCFDDQELDHVAKSMGMARVRRVPVLTRDDRLVGILSLGDVALRSPETAADAVLGVSQHGGPHS